MKILIFVKQIPDINMIRFDKETGRIIRENVPLIINPFDKRAVEEGIRLKEKYGYTVEVATMGPPQAIEVINESLRMGADHGFLITDRKYGGADTWATSHILSHFAKTRNPDLMICGRYSLDGETSQVPPEISKMCNYRFFSSVSKIEIEGDAATMELDREDGVLKVSAKMPMVISVSEKINRARRVDDSVPDMKDRVQILDSIALGLDFNGATGSLTLVDGVEVVESSRPGNKITMPEAVQKIKESMENGTTSVKPETIHMDHNVSSGTAMGIALQDPGVTMEIASLVEEISNKQGFRTVMAGNVRPENLKGMTAHEYYHLDSGDIYSLAVEIGRLMDTIKPEFVIFPSNSQGRDIASLLAAERKLGLTADCVDIKFQDGKLVQYKPAFGGGVIARILSKTKPEMATVRPGMFTKKLAEGNFQVKKITPAESGEYVILSHELVEDVYLPLQDANIVLGIGRGVKGKPLIQSIVEFAQEHSIGVGGTRPVVDMHLLPRQHQIGITGMAISPQLYVALGVSGMDNHMSGLRYAKNIISINNDPNAPINRLSDYWVEGTVEDFLALIREKFQK